MEIDETALSQSYSFTQLSVISSTQISTRVSQVIRKLDDAPPDGKPVIIAISAKSRAASKLISIVEIVKRELAAKDIQCCQYNGLSSASITVDGGPQKVKTDANRNGVEENEGDSSDEAFQTMGETAPKQKTVPVMTAYLSIDPVKELKGLG